MTGRGDPGDLDDDFDELLRLELALAERRERDLPGGYAAVLDEGFRETGASGRLWTREAILAALSEAVPSRAEFVGFRIEALAPGVALATYSTTGPRPAHRASIWVWTGERWRIRFHQGTLL